MKKILKIYKKILQFLLSIILLLAVFFAVSREAKANGGYWTTDVFTKDRSIKGAQSFLSAEAANSSNIFLNAFIDSGFIEDNYTGTDGYTEWEFEGETYYFKIPVDLYNQGEIAKLNNADLSVTVQLLVRYDPDRMRLIEPSAREYRGLNYYSPNMSEPAVIKEYRAFMDFMAEYFSQRRVHIDCWICGNEVNAPDMWNFYGGDCMTYAGDGRWIVSNINLIMGRYSKWYDIVYDAVKVRNPGARVCICLDHAWNEQEGGKTISAKQFLDLFAETEGISKDWCIAYHCYPAFLKQTDIWSDHTLNPKSEDARFIDGYNLEILTGYVKTNFGANHRIMLTEQGFSIKQGEDKQAACLVYTFYKARFDDMVDVMHIMKFNGSGFELGDTSKKIWEYLDDGDEEHEQWIFDQISETIGISSWKDITPAWKSQAELSAEKYEYLEENKYEFEGVDLSPVFDYDYYVANYPDVAAFFPDKPPTFYQMFWYFTRHGMSLAHQGSDNFNLDEYKNSHPQLVKKFGDENEEYYKYYSLTYGTDEESVIDFVTRFYTIILEREEIDDSELDYYASGLMLKEVDGSDVAKAFVMSPEYEEKKDSDQVFIYKMYRAFFNRAADDVDFYMNLLNNGESRETVLAGFINSPEFKNMCDSYGINPGELIIALPEENNQNSDHGNLDKYIENLYECILGRTYDEEGLNYWREQIISGQNYNAASAARIGFFESNEYLNKNTDNEQFVTDCYHTFLNREPEPEGLAYWREKLDSGEYSRQDVIESGFGESEEFKNILNAYGLSAY